MRCRYSRLRAGAARACGTWPASRTWWSGLTSTWTSPRRTRCLRCVSARAAVLWCRRHAHLQTWVSRAAGAGGFCLWDQRRADAPADSREGVKHAKQAAVSRSASADAVAHCAKNGTVCSAYQTSARRACRRCPQTRARLRRPFRSARRAQRLLQAHRYAPFPSVPDTEAVTELLHAPQASS